MRHVTREQILDVLSTGQSLRWCAAVLGYRNGGSFGDAIRLRGFGRIRHHRGVVIVTEKARPTSSKQGNT